MDLSLNSHSNAEYYSNRQSQHFCLPKTVSGLSPDVHSLLSNYVHKLHMPAHRGQENTWQKKETTFSEELMQDALLIICGGWTPMNDKSLWKISMKSAFFQKKMKREGLVKMEWKKAENWDNTTMQNRDQWYMLIFIMCKLFCSFTRGILLSIWW